MASNVRESVLLTGVGFTKNFGGFLAKDMWDRIYNNLQVQNCPSLVTLLRSQREDFDNYDFESVYYEVFTNMKYTDKEKDVIHHAVENVYKQLDKTVRNFWPNGQHAISHPKFCRFLDLFASDNQKKGYFFTLNQDCKDRHLLVIGYGFRDAHINNVISQSILQHGLKLFVISPSSHGDFSKSLLNESSDKKDNEKRKIILEKLSNYWSQTPEHIFSENQPYLYDEIREAVFLS